MLPYADFLFFGLLLVYVVIPTLILGLLGRANARWNLFMTAATLLVIFGAEVSPKPGWFIPQVLLAGGYAVFQGLLTLGFLRWKNRLTFNLAIALSLAPLVLVKFFPLFAEENSTLGFIGISYVTFRALDVIFSIQDRVITTLNFSQFFGYLFFFPTVSSGPIDRFRRFGTDWNRLRGRHEFLDDLDAAVQRVFQGFLYKYIIAALLKAKWVDPVSIQLGFWPCVNYMYAYTFYLFFDFAGYSAFAIGFSRLFGIRTPENFDKPFLSRNIRDFWNRWHMSLSFWFRDHVYMRFLLTAAKGKWFKGRHTSSYLGLLLTFGLMGIWHGPESYYLIYGAYHAALLSGYDAFARWNKQAKFWKDGRIWRLANILLTFHAIAFGLLIFSGRLSSHPLPKHEELLEHADCQQLTGWVWDSTLPNSPLTVDVFIDDTNAGRQLCNDYRADMKARGYGNGAHGFIFKLPPYVRDGHPHSIEVKITGTGRQLRGSPQQVSCPSE